MRNLIRKLREIEEKSTCAAKKVACIIFDEDKNILATGCNHSIGCVQCNEIFSKAYGNWYFKENNEWKYDKTKIKHKTWSLLHEVHAEIEALTNMQPNESKNLSCLVTYSPCIDCCKSLINAGIKQIYYLYEFDDSEIIKDLCKECNIVFKKINNEVL